MKDTSSEETENDPTTGTIEELGWTKEEAVAFRAHLSSWIPLWEGAGQFEDYNSWKSGLVNDPEIKGGETTFPGTRITVLGIGGILKQGERREDVLEDYPSLTDRDLDYAKLYVEFDLDTNA